MHEIERMDCDLVIVDDVDLHSTVEEHFDGGVTRFRSLFKERPHYSAIIDWKEIFFEKSNENVEEVKDVNVKLKAF